MLSISIVIPVYNDNQLIIKLLLSLSNIIIPDSLLEVIIVENGIYQKNYAIETEFILPIPIKYIYTKKASVANARNIGFKHSQADVVIFFDNDMTFNNDTLMAYDQAIQRYGLGFFYGGSLEANYEEKPPEWLFHFLPWSAKGHSLGDALKEIDQALFLGGNHAIPKQAMLELDVGYDEMCPHGDQLSLVGEETRLQEKLLQKGLKGIYVPKATVHHWVPKEKCSENWVLEREFRHGLTDAYEYDSHQEKKRSLLNVPLWIWKSYFIALLEFLKSLIDNSPNENKFKLKLDYYRIKGRVVFFLKRGNL